ncbi:MAG: phage tail tape measure protein [Hyphomicrobiales bacterium]
MDDTIHIPVEVDTSRAEKDLKALSNLADGFGTALTGALKSSVLSGQQMSSILSDLALQLSDLALQAALAPLSEGLSSGIGGVLSGLLGGIPGFANGGVFAAGNVLPFAKGGVVSAPSYFPIQGGLGLMGEAGPEAIVPLARGADGSLGVRGGGNSVSVSVNIQTRDMESFRKSEGYVSAMLARAVGRGQRNL